MPHILLNEYLQKAKIEQRATDENAALALWVNFDQKWFNWIVKKLKIPYTLTLQVGRNEDERFTYTSTWSAKK